VFTGFHKMTDYFFLIFTGFLTIHINLEFPLIICQDNGKPYSVDWYSTKFKRLLQDNGMRVIRLHDLRHSHATYSLKMGVNAKALQKRMGHSTFSTTMDTYSHVLDDMGREAAETLNTGLQSIVSNVI